MRIPPTAPVPEADWAKLPRRAQTGKLDRAAFVYDGEADCYYCPQGRRLAFVQVKAKSRESGIDSQYRTYQCGSCEGCGLSLACLSGRSQRRTVSHDQHERFRQATAARLKTSCGKATYARRAHLAETPNAVIKRVMGAASIPVAWVGQGSYGVVVGVYGVQPKETDGRGGGVGRRIRRIRLEIGLTGPGGIVTRLCVVILMR